MTVMNQISTAIYPANGFQIFVSQQIGSDSNTGSFFAPLETIGAAVTMAGSPSPTTPVTITLMGSATYNEQVVIPASVENLFIQGPSAAINFSGTGDALTIGNSAKLFINIATVTNSGTGNAITNNGGSLFGGIDVVQSATNAIVNAGPSGTVVLTGGIAIEGNITNPGAGNVIYQTLIRSGTDDVGVAGTSFQGPSTNWQIPGLATDTIGGTFNASISSSTINSSNLSSGGEVSVLPVNAATAQYQITGITLNGISATNFSGIGGDRDISITDGTNVWSVIPAAILQSFSGFNGVWGSVYLPLPTAIDMNQLTQPGQQLQVMYTGGTTDYTSGSFSLNIQYSRIV